MIKLFVVLETRIGINKTYPGNKLQVTELGGKCVSAPGYGQKDRQRDEF